MTVQFNQPNINNSIPRGARTVSGTVELNPDDDFVVVDSSQSSSNVQLYNGSGLPGNVLYIKAPSADVNSVTVTADGGTINGDPSYTLSSVGQAAVFKSIGNGDWDAIAEYNPESVEKALVEAEEALALARQADIAAEFPGAQPPSVEDQLNAEFTEVGPLDPADWNISGSVGDLNQNPPVVTQRNLGLEIDWTPSVQNQQLIIRRGDAPVGDFSVYAHLDMFYALMDNGGSPTNVNFCGIFAGVMAGDTVNEALFAGAQNGGTGPRFGGKTFTSSSQITGNFANEPQFTGMWVWLRYNDALKRGYISASVDGRMWRGVRSDVLANSPNSIGICCLSNQVTGAADSRRLVCRIRSFRVVPWATGRFDPLPTSAYE